MDPDLESDLGLHCLSERLLKHFSRRQKQTSFVVIVIIRVKFSPFFRQKRASTAGFSSADNYGFDRDDVSIWVNTQDFCTAHIFGTLFVVVTQSLHMCLSHQLVISLPG